MNYTIFNIKAINKIMRPVSVTCLKAFGWSVSGKAPDNLKYVIIAAPHTSNWDLPLTLLTAFALKLNLRWMGKDTLFRQPFKQFFMWLGGIPIDRSKSNSVVKQSIERFNAGKGLGLVISPAGTRTKVTCWRTGFYYIAAGAKVPIVLGFLDYRLKIAGLGPTVHPTGNMEKDMFRIRLFYQKITGKYPNKAIGNTKAE